MRQLAVQACLHRLGLQVMVEHGTAVESTVPLCIWPATEPPMVEPPVIVQRT